MAGGSTPGVRPALTIALSWLLMAAPLAGQQPSPGANLSGVVTETGSGRPIIDARVRVPNLSLETRTDREGIFELSGVPPGTHVLHVSLFGHLDLTRAIAVGTADVHVRLQLEASPFGLEGLTVTVDGVGAVEGRVVDAVTRQPIEGVVVWLPTVERGVSADSTGRFEIPDVPYGPQILQVRRAGYEGRMVPISFVPGLDPVDLALEPDRDLLARLPAVSQRLRGRRNAYPSIVTVHDTERLTLSGARDVREYLFKYTLVRVVPCSGMARSFWCIDFRGTPIEPQVCIDGWIEWGGLDLLQRMAPNELHLVEVYGSTGGLIRAYTHDYVEGLARGAGGVAADEPTPQREGVEGLGWASGRSDVQVTLGPKC